MDRRQYLAALAAVTALSGCSTASPDSASGDSGSDDRTESGPTTTGRDRPVGGTDRDANSGRGAKADGVTDTDGTRGGGGPTPPGDVELPIPESELKLGAPKDGIPAIVDPAFGSEADIRDRYLTLDPGDDVIGVERGGNARAYPLWLLDWHEVVNDTFEGPLLVTYCPLCGSGVTAERKVDGEETLFGVSGLLWNSDLVMYDEKTGSYWSQILGQAINGPKTGTTLELVPSTITAWSEWQDAHPDTEILLPPPESGRIIDIDGEPNYARSRYAGYEDSEEIGIGYNDFEDDRLHPKAIVIGVTHDGVSKAYSLEALGDNAVVNDAVARLPVVVASTDGGSLSAYERTVDGEKLRFENGDGGQMRAGGSRWEKATGTAMDGPHEGTQLVRANDRSRMFWFAWVDFHPDTDLYV